MTIRPWLVMALVCVGARSVTAQCATANGQANSTCSSNIASSLTIPTLLRLTVSDTSTSLTTPTEAVYDAGTVVSTGPTVTIKTNSAWTLLIRATAATWTASGVGARANKPVGELAWATAVGGPFTAMSTSDATVATGTLGANNTRSLHYRTNWDWLLDTPGTYTLTVVFTATSP